MSDGPPYGSWLPPATPGGGPPAPLPGLGEPREADGAPRWPPWTGPAALLLALALSLLGGILVTGVGAAFGASVEDPPPAVNIVATFVQEAAFVLAALLLAARAGALLPARFGFVRAHVGRALGWMFAAYAGYWVLAVAWAAAIGLDESDQLPESLGTDESTIALVSVCVLVTIVAPIAEELLFRGYMFGALRTWRGPWPAALITGALFGAVHVFGQEPEFLVPLAVLGVALCVVRWKTGSLLPCIALHAVNNALAFGVAESWTAGQTLLLAAAATAVALLVCRPFLAPRPSDAGALG